MELANRAVTSLELDRLARLYGRDLREFVMDDFQEHDALAALFRADSGVAEQSHVVDALRNCVAIGREVTSLERLLGVDHEGGAAAVYPLPAPRSRWQAVQQGERVAGQERQRLGLGSAPMGNIAELLETQNVRAAWIELPDDVSGLTMADQAIGELASVLGTRAACSALGRSRATYYRRHRKSPVPPRPSRERAPQPRALSTAERAEVLGVLQHPP